MSMWDRFPWGCRASDCSGCSSGGINASLLPVVSTVEADWRPRGNSTEWRRYLHYEREGGRNGLEEEEGGNIAARDGGG